MGKRSSRKRRGRDKDVNKWLQAAKQRLTTAEFLAENRMYLDSMYLAGYCPECVLKAVIISRVSKHKRERYVKEHFRSARGHDYEHLKELLLKDFKVRLPDEIAALLHQTAWTTDLRYAVGRKDAREAETFLDTCHQILKWGERSV